MTKSRYWRVLFKDGSHVDKKFKNPRSYPIGALVINADDDVSGRDVDKWQLLSKDGAVLEEW